jgi:hypothetical protein
LSIGRSESKRRNSAREFGNLFGDGMAQLLGRTEDKGPEQERENARVIAKEAGLSPEIAGILGLNTSAAPSMIDIEQPRVSARLGRGMRHASA